MRRILHRLAENLEQTLGLGTLLLIGALLVISLSFHIPGLDAPEALTHVARYLSYALLPLSILCVLRYSFPRPHLEVVVGVLGVVVALEGMRGSIASVGVGVLFLGACVVVTLLLALIAEVWRRLVDAQGWTWTSWVASGVALVWKLVYTSLGLAMVGSAAYLVYFGFTADFTPEEPPWFIFPLMATVPGWLGFFLLVFGIRSIRETLRGGASESLPDSRTPPGTGARR